MTTPAPRRSGCSTASSVGAALHRPGEQAIQGVPGAGHDRFDEPNWPQLSDAKIFRLGFRDKGRLIDSTEHRAVQEVGSP